MLMPKVWRVPRPDPYLFEAELRALAPHLNVPIIGQEAICQWFYDHGFRGKFGGPPTWRMLKEWQVRVGEPFLFHAPHPATITAPRTGDAGLLLGKPVATVLTLTRWCMCQSYRLSRSHVGYIPAKVPRHRRRA